MGWTTSASATAHCLTGCAIGEVIGIAAGAALGLSPAVTVALAVVLAFCFGYALTVRGMLGHMSASSALRVALAADTVSIATMELTDNAVMIVIPGAMQAGVGDWLMWTALALSLAASFLAAWPVNHWLIGRGRGHALHHHHHSG
jgi:hypothetical protein